MKIRMGTLTEKFNLKRIYPGLVQVIKGSGELVVAVESNRIIGFAWVFYRKIPAPLNGETECFINAIEVFEQRDKNKGTASEMVQYCAERGRKKGCYQLRAYCDIHNVASHRLWLKNRFGISPDKQLDGTISGSFVTLVL